jgi:hypothetical protein
MPNLPNIITLRTGSGVYEIVESEDGQYVTIREAGNRERQLRFERSAIPALVKELHKLDLKTAKVPKSFKSY